MGQGEMCHFVVRSNAWTKNSRVVRGKTAHFLEFLAFD
jgi:hypothetical protein